MHSIVYVDTLFCGVCLCTHIDVHVRFQLSGTGVIDHHIGQRVGYVNATKMGAFSETSIVPVNILIPLPSHLSNEQAAAILFPGLTTWMLLKKVYPVRRGDLILVHNAASGLGAIISQWARSLRAFVIGTVGEKEEIEHAKNNGCSGVVVDGGSGFVDGVRELTDGEGIAVSFYSAGKRSLTESLECLAPKGMLVSVGATKGETSVDFKDLAGDSLCERFIGALSCLNIFVMSRLHPMDVAFRLNLDPSCKCCYMSLFFILHCWS